ncbi:MAG: DUF3794 domain-containing protein [Oscillospiraceae bacterium]|nr:DUF3794 domain-containing protein [Oscillospiraceae bacterium]
MDLKVTKETISSLEIIFSDTNEQSVELDYILPDYCPEIFKILKCITIPSIISHDIVDDKLSYEMEVCIRVLYCTENNPSVQSIEQKLTYFKKIELGRKCTNPDISVTPQVNYINCRAVNQRRLDIRGAVLTTIIVKDLISNDIITDVSGGNIQLKKESVTYQSDYIKSQKTVNISDKFDLGMSKPPILNIIRSDAVITSIDNKIIANKLIIKGEICINMLYTYLSETNNGIEAMQFTLPFSHVLDMEGIDDRFKCSVNADVVLCNIKPYSDGDGNSKSVECDMKVIIFASAYRTATADLVIDEYSTSYKTNSEKSSIKIELPSQAVNSSCVIKNTLSSTDDEIDCVNDVWCTIKNYTVNNDNNIFVINGNVVYYVMGKNSEGNPIFYEKEDSFISQFNTEGISENSILEVKLIPMSCSYNLASDSNVEIKAELKMLGCIRNTKIINGITDIEINEDELLDKNQNYALKIYYTDENEDLWEIAKKYGTSVTAIIEENEIEDDMITGNGMILIPIV